MRREFRNTVIGFKVDVLYFQTFSVLHIGSVAQMRKDYSEVELTPDEAEGMIVSEHFPSAVMTAQNVSVFINVHQTCIF